MTEKHEPVGQVGCIDGSVLVVHRHTDEVLRSVASTEFRLSAETDV